MSIAFAISLNFNYNTEIEEILITFELMAVSEEQLIHPPPSNVTFALSRPQIAIISYANAIITVDAIVV